MFEIISEKLQTILSKLKSRGQLSEKNIDEALRQVRLSLLEADVNFQVVKDFIARVKERAIGKEVMESLTPGQQVIKIVSEELTELMGPVESKLTFSPKPPTVIMLIGLQGSGKTSASAKLAYWLKTQGKHPFLVAADVYRPAAIKQLEILAREAKAPIYTASPQEACLTITKQGVKKATESGADVVIVDTAGRLHIDTEMMSELKQIKDEIRPHEILLVVDAMTGQDAINIAQAFEEQLGFDGVIMTKLDSDSRGGAALSIKASVGRPVKLASVGEKLGDIQVFHPERMASRILGLGDVMTLIEKAESALDEKKALALEEKLRKEEFTLEDFLVQMRELKKMGPLSQMLEMFPAAPGLPSLKNLDVDDKKLVHLEAIIQSMTPEERRKPSLISGSRRFRIARGSGTTPQEVNQLLKQFAQVRKLFKQFGQKKGRFLKGKPFPFGRG